MDLILETLLLVLVLLIITPLFIVIPFYFLVKDIKRALPRLSGAFKRLVKRVKLRVSGEV